LAFSIYTYDSVTLSTWYGRDLCLYRTNSPSRNRSYVLKH